MHHSTRAALLASLFAPWLLAGCGGDESTNPAANAGCTDEAAAACLVDQQACAPSGAGCVACGEGTYAGTGHACTAIEGTALTHDFASFEVNPGEEVLGQCQSWTLGNAEEIWVNTVELVQDEASHHSNWTFVPADQFEGPDGVWKCKERNYTQLAAALSGGVLYAQSTQAAKEVQKFPDGAAVRIPPYSRIIGDVHLLNTTAEKVTGHARLSIYGIPASDVTVKLVPFHLTFETLDIPPKATSRFEASCDLKSAYGGPMDLTLYYTLPHTHALGTRMFFGPVGGPLDGQLLMDVRGFDGEAHGIVHSPPVSLDGSTGLRFGCEFENPRDESVHWGFDDQEMCEMLGFADSDVVFESAVSTLDAPTMADGMPRYSGKCETLAVPWDHDKPGGPPPP